MKLINKLAVWSIAAMAVVFTACEDNMITGDIGYPDENVSRLFAPIEFSYVSPIIDGYELEWSSVRGAEGYFLQFSEDSLFNEGADEYYAGHPDIVRTVYADTVFSPVGKAKVTGLGLDHDLFIRVSAFAAGVGQSHWLVSSKSYKTLDRPLVEMLKQVDRNDVYANEATVYWYVDSLVNHPMDQLIIKVNGTEEETVVTLDAATQQAGSYTFTGLLEGTTYLVRGHDSSIEGEFGDYNEVSFKTKSGAGDAVVYDGVENFNELIARLPNGSTIYIPAGMYVTCVGSEGNPSNIIIDKDLTIRGESSTEGKPTISVKEFRLSGLLSSVTFENIKLEGQSGWSYVINLHKDQNFLGCDELAFIDCEITGYGNAIVRHQAAEATGLGKIIVDNCYVHDMNVEGSQSYAMFMFKNTDYFVNEFVLTNSTFYNIGTNIIEHRSKAGAGRNCNATIKNCTFQNCGKNSRYMFDFGDTDSGNILFEKNLFGAVMDPATHKGYRGKTVSGDVVNCYATDDFVFASATDILGNATPLGAAAADVFVDAANGDLTLTGAAAPYAGTIGDPRWW